MVGIGDGDVERVAHDVDRAGGQAHRREPGLRRRGHRHVCADRAPEALMRIAHFGTFDVDNYGDLLFPHLAEWRLPDSSLASMSTSRRAWLPPASRRASMAVSDENTA